MFTPRRIAVYIIALAAFLLVSCTAQQGATTTGGGTGGANTAANPALPTPVGSFVYPTATNQALSTPVGTFVYPTATNPSLPTPVGSFVYPTEGTGNATPRPTVRATAVTPASKISPGLAQRMAANPSDIAYDILLEQADYSGVPLLPPTEVAKESGRRAQEVADRTQPPVKDAIVKLQLAGEIKDFHAFVVCNCFTILGTAHSVEMLAARQDVKRLELIPKSDIYAPLHPAATPLPVSPSTQQNQGVRPSGGTGWNATAINRNEAWSYTQGTGSVVGVIDSGVAYLHPALNTRWRGYGAGVDYNWSDFPDGSFATSTPYDNIGHGTFTTGVIVGGDPGRAVGMAPLASWIACRLDGNTDFGFYSSELACLGWMFRPTDMNNNNPMDSKRPNVINGSWEIPSTVNDNSAIENVIRTLNAGGVVTVFASGNDISGASSGSIVRPASYPLAVAAGAVGYPTASVYPTAFYSKYGPSSYTHLAKPEVMAPGGSGDNPPDSSSILSSVPTPGGPCDPQLCDPSGYHLADGTSEAAPHVAAVAALLYSYNPSLSPGEIVYYIEHGAAKAAAGLEPDNNTGWGLINARNSLDILASCTPNFTDIGGDVFYDAIKALACGNVVNGTGGTLFSPAAASTRAQFTKIVCLAFGVPINTPTATPPGPPTFPDVPPSYWAYQYIESAHAAGIISGYADGYFRPDYPVTRAQASVMIQNIKQYTVYSPPNPTFSDVPPDYFAYSAIETLNHAMVVKGYGDGTFRPYLDIRRDELCGITYKAIQITTN